MVDPIVLIADSLLSQVVRHLAADLKGRLTAHPKDGSISKRLTFDQERLLREAITVVANEVFASVGLGNTIDAIIEVAVKKVEQDPSILVNATPGAISGNSNISFEASGNLQAALKATKTPFKLSKRAQGLLASYLINVAAGGTLAGGGVAYGYVQAQQQVTTLVVTGTNINVRSVPTKEGNAALATLNSGDQVTKIAEEDEWVHIRIDDPNHPRHGLVGYVNKKYLRPSI